MAVVLAMMNVIIAENLYNKEFVEKYTVGFAELAEHVKQYTPEWAEKNQKSQRLRFTGLPGNLQKMETNRLGRYTTKKRKSMPQNVNRVVCLTMKVPEAAMPQPQYSTMQHMNC